MAWGATATGGSEVEKVGKDIVPPPAHVGLLVRLRLRQHTHERGAGVTADIYPSTGIVPSSCRW